MSEEEEEDEAVFEALAWLVRHEASVRESYGNKARRLREELGPAWPAITESQLEYNVRGQGRVGDTHATGGWVYLPQLPRGSGRIPLLNAKYDRKSTPMELSLQVAIFWCDDCDVKRADAWRFESPEGTGEDVSDHGYYHAQPCAQLRTSKRDVPIDYSPAKYAANVPTFPLDACDAVSLLVAMLVTFYGRRDGTELIRAAAIPALERALHRMRGMRPVIAVP